MAFRRRGKTGVKQRAVITSPPAIPRRRLGPFRLFRRPGRLGPWLRRPKLPHPWWRPKAKLLGHAQRSRVKGLLRLALPILRYCFRRKPLASGAQGAPREAARVKMEPLQFGHFEVRLAQNGHEVELAQALRYRIFYEEMGAVPTREAQRLRRDCDGFDGFCDHLIVVDREQSNGTTAIVGTYRLLRRSVALVHGGFYSQSEFDLSPLMTLPGEIVELGRSCVDPAYRSRGVMQMLWRGLAAYIHAYDIHLMFGCASFPGIKPREIAPALSYLYYHHLAPRPLRPRALPQHYVPMAVLPRAGLDVQTAIGELPPLIKGYLRVGGFVGDGAVIDRQFNTTDVCVIVKTDQLTSKYERRYRRPAESAAPS